MERAPSLASALAIVTLAVPNLVMLFGTSDALAAKASPKPTPTASPTPTSSTGTGVVRVAIVPEADATVRAARPTRNEGAQTTLSSDGDPVLVSYLRFDLGSLPGGRVTRAILELRTTRATSSTHAVRSVADTTWGELSITYQNRPAVGSSLASVTGGGTGRWIAADVTGAIAAAAGGRISLAIDTLGADALVFSSREASAADRVRLSVDLAEQITPSPTPEPSPSPTPTPTPTPSLAPSPTPDPSPTLPPTPSRTPIGSTAKGIALRPFAEFWGSDAVGMAGDLDDLVGAGIGWARIDLYLGTFPLPAFDTAVSLARDRGIRLIAVAHKSAPTNDLGTNEERAAYRSTLAEAVRRYGHWVRDWEIQNEPNLHYEWAIDESVGSDQERYRTSVLRYVALLADAHETIRSVDPDATILFGGLSEWTVERYLDVLVTTDAHRYFDVLSFHPYGRDPSRCVARFQVVRDRLAAVPAFSGKPIRVTEIGFNTTWTSLAGYVASEETKADYLAAVLTGLRDAGASGPHFWYTLHENSRSSGFGLTIRDRLGSATTYLPAYHRYRDLDL